MDLVSTIEGSLLENFFPAGWDLKRIDELASLPAERITERQSWWHAKFQPVVCETVPDFDVMMGHEIALTIAESREQGREQILILPVGPMGMYRWAVYFLNEWHVPCDHVHGFNMDEWSDREGNTLPPSNPGAFQNAMQQAFYGPLGDNTVPAGQRFFATKSQLPRTLAELRSCVAAERVLR